MVFPYTLLFSTFSSLVLEKFLGLSSIPPVSVYRQEILDDYRYLGHPKISIHKKIIKNM